MLVSFVVGLVISNALVAAFSTLGFVSAGTRRHVYLAVGILTAVFSLVVGAFFIAGLGAGLPDLQDVLGALFGLAQRALWFPICLGFRPN